MKRRSVVVLLPFLLLGCGYNQIQKFDERAEQAKKNIANQLQRRADLIPNLVATVKGYAAHEADVFTRVTEARAAVVKAASGANPEAAEMAAANSQLTSALGRLIAVAEAYPTLKADQNFRALQDELAGTENRIAVARNDYNQSVREYNEYIRQFPTVLTAKVSGAKPRQYFELTTPDAANAPKVDFSKPPPQP